MKLLVLLVCSSMAAGIPVLQKRSMPSVYDYYDFVEIPRNAPMASSRSDSPVMEPMARSSGPLPRRIPLPLPPRRPSLPKKRSPFSGPRPQQPRPFREPDYQLTEGDALPQQYRQRPNPQQQQPRPRPQFQPRPQQQQQGFREPEPEFFDYQDVPAVYEEEPIYPEDESVFVELPQYPRESPVYQNERPIVRDHKPTLYQEDVIQNFQEERRPQFQEERRPQFQENRRPQFQEDRRPQFQEERRPQFQEERRPQFQEERRPQFQEERRPQFQEERRPQFQEDRRPQFQEERQPQYEEERQPIYQEERAPQYQEERPPFYEEEQLPQYQGPSEKDAHRPPLNNYRTTQDKATESVKEKRETVSGGGHLDDNGLKFAADAAAVENAKGAGRLAFQIHGQQGPHSYRFGYDTGKGYNRQFRYEERDGEGIVHGRYGFYDKDGELQVVNYSAHPKHGFSADVPEP